MHLGILITIQNAIEFASGQRTRTRKWRVEIDVQKRVADYASDVAGFSREGGGNLPLERGIPGILHCRLIAGGASINRLSIRGHQRSAARDGDPVVD